MLRVLLAAVFAAMSGIHTPAMALAGTGSPTADTRDSAHVPTGHLSLSMAHARHTAHGNHTQGSDARGSDAHHHGGHHDHGGDAQADAQADTQADTQADAPVPFAPSVPNVCFDCCTAVAPPAIAAPGLIPIPLATLKPRPLKAPSPFVPESTDPPPRLHV